MPYTESVCNLCPRQCRAGIFLSYERVPRVCPTGKKPNFVAEDNVDALRPSHTLADPVTEIPAGVTMLLGCTGCGKSPCLLEITGPAGKPPCLLDIVDADKIAWFRVTS